MDILRLLFKKVIFKKNIHEKYSFRSPASELDLSSILINRQGNCTF